MMLHLYLRIYTSWLIFQSWGLCRLLLSCVCPCCLCVTVIVELALELIKAPIHVIEWFTSQIPCWCSWFYWTYLSYVVVFCLLIWILPLSTEYTYLCVFLFVIEGSVSEILWNDLWDDSSADMISDHLWIGFQELVWCYFFGVSHNR